MTDPTTHLAERIEAAIGLNVDCGGAEGVYRLRDLVMAEVQPVLDRLAEYESAICWETTCLSCSRMLDACREADERAEKAEAELAEALPKPTCICGGQGIAHLFAEQHDPIGETP